MTVHISGKRGLYFYEFTFNTTRYRGPCKTKNKQTAERIEAKLREDLALGRFDLVNVKDSKKQLLFKDAAPAFIERRTANWEPKTLAMHKTSLPKVVDYFGKMTLNQIKSDHIELYQKHRKEQITMLGTPPSNRTINTEVILVRQVLGAKLWRKLREDSTMRMMKEKKSAGQVLTREQVIKLLLACKTSNTSNLFPAVMLSIFLGLRSKELKLLKWKQIDFERRCITVGNSKTKAGEGRIVYLSPLAFELIKNWRGNYSAMPNHYVFPAQNGSRVMPEKPYSTWQRTWDAAREDADVYIRWHDLRHSCASIMGAKGVPETDLMEIFGWDSEQARIYVHSYQQQQRQAMVHIDEFFAGVLNQEPIKQETIQ